MRVVIAGSSGFLGTALRERLAEEGHDVVRLVRAQAPSAKASVWDPARGHVDQAVIDGADVVINVAGASIIRPWTPARRRLIAESRVATARTLAEAIARSPGPPVFLQQSGTDAYGNRRADLVLTESTEPVDSGFFHDVVRRWEAATEPAQHAGARVCLLRTGAVIDRRGGPLRPMLPFFRLGIAGRVGDGRQYFPVISLHDWAGAVLHLADRDESRGPYNLTAPNPPTNAEFTAALGRALHRPTPLRAPAPVLRLVLRELSGQLLGSMRAVPKRLLAEGFTFRDATVDQIVAAALR